MEYRSLNDRTASNREAKRRFDEKAASIDQKLDAARNDIDWERREKAEKSLADWVDTYCVGLLLDDAPPPKGRQILDEMERALNDSRPYMIMMGRGNGKTCYVECATVYAMATGKRRFPVVISANARAACNILNDIFRIFIESDTDFAQDYPDLCLPMQLQNGSYRRKQTYRGISTEISKTANQATFARLQTPDGKLPTSGCVIATRGISSGIRGLKHRTMRPDLVLLDDLQMAEDASNPSTVEKLLDIIKKDVFNLAGKGKLAVLQTATPICPEDLTERIASDPIWKTTVWPSIIKWPKDIEDNGDKGLWGEYFRMYDTENVADKAHDDSLRFYKKNRAKMDDGSEVFNPSRFKLSDGHVSALQALLEKRHMIGDAAFSAEMQMKPKRYSCQLDLSPKVVVSKIGQTHKLEVPDGFVFVAASTDLNVSHAATTAIVAFKTDMTSRVICYKIHSCHIDQTLNETEYNQAVFDLLVNVGKWLKGLGVKIDGWAIDAGGRNWDAVCNFSKNARRLVQLPACAFAGRASHIFNPFVRSRLRDAIGRTVLCGSPEEHIKSGAGNKYVFFDADLCKEMAQRAFMSELDAPGSCSLYYGSAEEHSEFAIQVCNEKLLFVKHGQDGRNTYRWKSAEPHDYLDCMSMCYAVATSQGLSSASASNSLDQLKKPKHKAIRAVHRLKIRIV